MRTSFAAVLMLLVVSGSVRAQDTITLLVRERGMAPRDLGFVVGTLSDALNQKPGILAEVPARPLGGDDLAKAGGRATALLAEARELYKKFDESGALLKLAESRAALVAGCGGADAGLLCSQEFLEGLIHFTAGRRDQAMLSFSRLAALDPSFEPDTTRVAPKVVAAFHEAQGRVRGEKPGLLDLSGRPHGARVLLDGRESKTLPAVFDRVPPGGHCLQVDDPAHGAWVARLTMPAGGTVRMRAVLFPHRAAGLLGGPPGLPRGADPGELARIFGTGYLALGDAWESRVTLRLICAKTGKVSGPVVCRAEPALESLLPCLHDGLVSARAKLSAPPAVAGLKEHRPPAPPAEEIQADGSTWYRSWWFWAIVGGVALAGSALTIGLVLSGGEDSLDYWVTVTTGP
jgi:hypothetical protein